MINVIVKFTGTPSDIRDLKVNVNGKTPFDFEKVLPVPNYPTNERMTSRAIYYYLSNRLEISKEDVLKKHPFFADHFEHKVFEKRMYKSRSSDYWFNAGKTIVELIKKYGQWNRLEWIYANWGWGLDGLEYSELLKESSESLEYTISAKGIPSHVLEKICEDYPEIEMTGGWIDMSDNTIGLFKGEFGFYAEHEFCTLSEVEYETVYHAIYQHDFGTLEAYVSECA